MATTFRTRELPREAMMSRFYVPNPARVGLQVLDLDIRRPGQPPWRRRTRPQRFDSQGKNDETRSTGGNAKKDRKYALHRRPSSRLDLNGAFNLGLAGQDVATGFFVVR